MQPLKDVELAELPGVVDIVTATRALGLSRTYAYQLARNDQFFPAKSSVSPAAAEPPPPPSLPSSTQNESPAGNSCGPICRLRCPRDLSRVLP